MRAYKVAIIEQDGLGGGNQRDIWFSEYDDAHHFYMHLKSKYGTPFYTSAEPPQLSEVPCPRIFKKGEWQHFESIRSGVSQKK